MHICLQSLNLETWVPYTYDICEKKLCQYKAFQFYCIYIKSAKNVVARKFLLILQFFLSIWVSLSEIWNLVQQDDFFYNSLEYVGISVFMYFISFLVEFIK